jgi:hypothetical protein
MQNWKITLTTVKVTDTVTECTNCGSASTSR